MKDEVSLVRLKKDWVPEWLWWVAAHVDRRATFGLALSLTRELTREELINGVDANG